MPELLFDWNEDKALANFEKHGVSFEEAKSVFNDIFSITVADPDHSENEDRWLDIGLNAGGKLLVVCYTERADVIRIIGCRPATNPERLKYEDERARQTR